MSGWDITNAAQALSLPQSMMKKLENSPLSSMFSNSSLLYQNTSLFDRIVACIFYGLLMFSTMLSCTILGV